MSNPTCNLDSLLAGCSQLTNLSQKQLQAEIIYLMAVQLAAVGGTDYTKSLTGSLLNDATAALGVLDQSKLPSCEAVIRYNQAVGLGINVPGFEDRQSALGCLLTLSDQDLLRIKTLLLCQLGVGTASDGRAKVIFTIPSDPDAANFVCGWLRICSLVSPFCSSVGNCDPSLPVPIDATCADMCGITQHLIDCISTLVTSLKSSGLWDQMDIIYPFVGGNFGSCSLNLKDATKFQITWGGGMTFSKAGVSSDGTTGFGDTGWVPSTNAVNFILNSAALGAFVKSPGGSELAAVCGTATTIGLDGSTIAKGIGIPGWHGKINDFGGSAVVNPSSFDGLVVISRTASNLKTIYASDGSTSTDATASLGLSPYSMYVPGSNFGGIPTPAITGTVEFFFASAGLDSTAVSTASSIINTFVTCKTQ